MINTLGMNLLRDAIEEYIDIPLREHDNRATAEEVEDASKVEAKSVVNRDDTEGYLNSLRGVPYRRWLETRSGIRRV